MHHVLFVIDHENKASVFAYIVYLGAVGACHGLITLEKGNKQRWKANYLTLFPFSVYPQFMMCKVVKTQSTCTVSQAQYHLMLIQ